MTNDDQHRKSRRGKPESDKNDILGLPWPEAYQDILPVIREHWGIESGLYLNRKLSGGRSGALVYAADVDSQQFTGQAILKLDQVPDPTSLEQHEADLHHQAIDDAPAFAALHLPRLLHTLHHKQQIAVLSAIAGRGLEYATLWTDCAFEKQLQMVRQVSRGLLEDWNQDYKRLDGMRHPTELLQSWLAYRLEPELGGRLHDFLSLNCAIMPDTASITFEGNWYPNPLAFALGKKKVPDHLRLRMISGHCHGDMHGQNVLVGQPQSSESEYYLIDLAFYQSGQYLFYDHAYFEAAFLLNSRSDASASDWESILGQLSHASIGKDKAGSRTEDIGLIGLVRALRQEVADWIDRHEGDRLSYMESQYLLARVAAGLNFANKNLPDGMRRRAFIFAASNLKDYVKLNKLDWPKYGPPFMLDGDAQPSGSIARNDTMIDPVEADQPAAMVPETSAAPEAENPSTVNTTRLGSLWTEIRRRHVVKVAGLYLIVAWVCVQVAGAMKTPLLLPVWTDTLVTMLLALGFPIACIIAWAFELSPGGLQRTTPADVKNKSVPRNRDLLDYVVAAGIVGLLAFTIWQHRLDYFGNEPSAVAGGSEMPSIAVLPFKNLSPDGTGDYLSDGLTIEIMATLARTRQFRIPGQTSTFRYKDQAEDLRTIGEDLGVQFLLEGSVRRVGNELRVETQLIEANDGFLVWSDVFTDEVEDIFVIQQNIANAIGTALKTPLGIEASGLQTGRTDNPEAYDLFLKAIALASRRTTDINLQISKGIELLRKSVEIEPDFAAGWAALSIAYDFAVAFPQEIDGRLLTPAVYVRRASSAAEKARGLDPDLAIVEHAMANVERQARHWSSAEDLYRKVLAQEPNNVLAMFDYARLLATVGHDERAIAMTEDIYKIDPHNRLLHFTETLYEWRINPTTENAEKILVNFGKDQTFDPFILRSTMGFLFDSRQAAGLQQLLMDCTTCNASMRDSALAMVASVGSEPPEIIFDKYKDERFLGYSFLKSIGGADLVLKAFEYYANSRSFNFQLYLVPWAEMDLVGKTDRFQQLIEDLWIDDYWRERGWPNRCQPLEGDHFECE